MGFYKYLRDAYQEQGELLEKVWKERLITWRQGPVSVRVERPTRLDRARSLGYRAKPGLIIVRQRLNRGGRMREQIRAGRRSKHFRRQRVLSKNYQQVAEERAARAFPNCEVLNSYLLAQDGTHYWFEVFLLDRAHPSVLADPVYSRIAAQRGRSARGLTSAGRRARGLWRKGKGAEKVRPSLRAHGRRGN